MHLLTLSPGEGFDPPRWRGVLRSGVDGLLIREPSLEARALLDLARWCQDTAPEVRLWVRGRLDVALAAGVGLHAPEIHPDVPPDLVPRSRPLHAESQLPGRADADQLLISPIFPVPGKGDPWGPARLHALLDHAPAGPRLLALGGLTQGRAPALRHPRLDGLALIRALWQAPEPARVVEEFRGAWG